MIINIESIQGHRDYMEDNFNYIESNGIFVAMICDGHGGAKVSEDTAKTLPQILLHKMTETKSATNISIAEQIRNVIIDWGFKLKGYSSGSTLTGVIIKNNILFIFNVGDSRTCMQLKPNSFVYHLDPMFDNDGVFIDKLKVAYNTSTFFCTDDHNADSAIERTRVVNKGGQLIGGRLNGILSLTRALGDYDIGAGLSFVPDIYWCSFDKLAGPIILMSDGAYEQERNARDLSTMQRLYNIGAKLGPKVLVKHAYEKGSEDNITVMRIA